MNFLRLLTLVFFCFLFLKLTRLWSESSVFSSIPDDNNVDTKESQIESIEQEVDLEDELHEDYDDMEEKVESDENDMT